MPESAYLKSVIPSLVENLQLFRFPTSAGRLDLIRNVPAFIEMKIVQVTMCIFQYAYYRMAEWDNKPWGGWGGTSKPWGSTTRMKVILLFGLVEVLIAAALYSVIYHIILARPEYIPSKPIQLVIFSVVGIALTFINQSILGPESRITHYRKIFVTWDKKKQMEWNLYLVLILLLSFAACIHEMGVNVGMLHSK